jgi:hypothetical protein
MAASLLVGLSARLLQWQNPAEFGVQFLDALRARRAQGKIATPLSATQNQSCSSYLQG